MKNLVITTVLMSVMCYAPAMANKLPSADPNPTAQELEMCGHDTECIHSAYLNRAPPKILERLAEKGDAQAAMFLGMAYLVGGHIRYSDGSFGYELPVSVDSFLRLNKLAVQNGSTEALRRLIAFYVYGLDYFKVFDSRSTLQELPWRQDWSSACKFIEATNEDLVLKSGAIVLYIGGQCYLTDSNVDRGISYLTVAAQNYESAPSAKLLSDIYRDGRYGVRKSPETSANWLSTYTLLLQKH